MRESEFMQSLQLRIGEEIAEELPKSSSWSLIGMFRSDRGAAALILVWFFYRWFWVNGGFLGHGDC